MNIIKKCYQNAKSNQQYLQSHNSGLQGWFYIALGSAFVATRICAMIENDIHWSLFLKSFFGVFIGMALLRYAVSTSSKVAV